MVSQRILLVEDDANLAEALRSTLVGAGYEVHLAQDGQSALDVIAEHTVQLIVTDVQMSPMDGTRLLAAVREQHAGLPVILMTAFATVNKAVEAMRLGADSYLVKPFSATQLIDAVSQSLKQHRTMAVSSIDTGEVVCGDPDTVALLTLASRVAASDATLLLSGESGTGKEVFARFVHNNSERADAPFVAINCAAIPDSMLEATLFGYEKGAYTGASKAVAGKFEQANGGTILLDEISEMDINLQAKLLRVLQEREVERLGSSKSLALDLRVLATTNRNLAAEVEAGRFREDLYYRLNVFPLHIPALRDRRGDIAPLFQHMLKRYCRGQRAVPRLSPRAERRLLQHNWPGNVRELENLVQRTLILLSGDEISESDIAFEITAKATDIVTPIKRTGADLHEDLRIEEQRLITDALRSGAGNREAAAQQLGISPRTLRYKMARLRDAGLGVPDFHKQSGSAATAG